MPRAGHTPTVSYGDAYSIGQLANQWERDTSFIRRLIAEGKLRQNERGLITNAALHTFYREHGHPNG